MFLSKYASKIKIKNNYVILNNLFFKPIILNKEKTLKLFNNNFNSFNNEEINILLNKGILINNKEQDEIAKITLKNNINNMCNKKISLLYMIPANACNLCCKYCFIGKIKNNMEEYMSENTIKNTIEKFSKHLKENNLKGNIIFYGGEPTLKLDILELTVKYINEFAKDIMKISMVTNCTLIDDKIIKFLKDNNVSVGVSIDGPKELTDKYRIFKEKKESVYDIVRKNINKLKNNNINFGLSIVVSNETLEDKNYLNWLKELNVKNINFNLMHYTEMTDDWKIYYKKIGKFLFNANNILEKSNISDSRVLRKFVAFYNNEFKYSDCAAMGGEQLCIKPNGDIIVCHAYWNSDKEICGNINKNEFDEILNTNIYKDWQQNLTINKEKCLKCPAVYICGGGCARQSETIFGNRHTIDKSFCLYTKYALKELLKISLNTNL